METLTPLSHWIGFHIYIVALLGIELLYARRRTSAVAPSSQDSSPADSSLVIPIAGNTSGASPQETAAAQKVHRTSIVASILWIAAALTFALFIFRTLGSTSAIQYLAGYAIEESLSIDNLFVFLLLFQLFKIQPSRQPRVLFWGVAGAILMRGAFIAAGLGLLARFHWISYVFALILLAAAVRLLIPQERKEEQGSPRWVRWLSRIHPISLRQDIFFTIENGRRVATMLLLCLVAIEITDIVFALDSIPAVLSITRHPFLAYTSNIMAVMGLRSLYFLLAHLLVKLRFLHYGLAAVLAFAALKMISTPWIELGPILSLVTIVTILVTTIVASLIHAKQSEVVIS